MFMNASSYEGIPIGYFGDPARSAMGLLFTNSQFLGAKVGLDTNYFSGDIFRESTLVYDGSEAFISGTATL
jgi:hypothetical protein